MFNSLSKILSALTFALSEPEERRQYPPVPKEPTILIVDKKSYPLTALEQMDKEASYTLDFGSKCVKGRQQFPFSSIKRIETANTKYGECVSFKIKLGPQLCFEPSESYREAQLLGERIAERLGLHNGVCSTWPDQILGPALDSIKRNKISGNLGLLSAERLPEGLVMPVALCVENENRIDAWGDIVFASDKVLLYDGVGKHEVVCAYNKIEDWSVEEGIVYQSDSEHETIELKFRTATGLEVELTFRASQVHDDRIAGEYERAEREMELGRQKFQELAELCAPHSQTGSSGPGS